MALLIFARWWEDFYFLLRCRDTVAVAVSVFNFISSLLLEAWWFVVHCSRPSYSFGVVVLVCLCCWCAEMNCAVFFPRKCFEVCVDGLVEDEFLHPRVSGLYISRIRSRWGLSGLDSGPPVDDECGSWRRVVRLVLRSSWLIVSLPHRCAPWSSTVDVDCIGGKLKDLDLLFGSKVSCAHCGSWFVYCWSEVGRGLE